MYHLSKKYTLLLLGLVNHKIASFFLDISAFYLPSMINGFIFWSWSWDGYFIMQSFCKKIIKNTFHSVRGNPPLPSLIYLTTKTVFNLHNLSLVMKKTFFCKCENKDADQLRSYCKADQRLCFAIRIVKSLYYLNPKFHASSHLLWLYSPVCVGPGRKPRRPVFSQ